MRRFCAAAMVAVLAQMPLRGAPDFEAAARAIVDELSAREFDKVTAQFDEKMTAALPAQKLAAVWDTVIGSVGGFKAVSSAKVQDVQGVHVVDLTCEFSRSSLNIRVTFRDDSRVSGLFVLPVAPPATAWNAPEYVDPTKFSGRDVTVGALNLPGTMLVPNGSGPFPAVVLVHGSGPLDRDETVFGHKVFLDIAEGLATRGIASVRYDKRTTRQPLGNGTVKEEAIDDAQAAVAMLEKVQAINAKKIVLLGHSLGGTLAPWLARDNRSISGIVILAGGARPLEDAIVDQIKYLTGPSSSASAGAEKMAAQVRSGNYGDGNIGGLSGAYWRALRDYRPAETAAALTIPILVLQGDRDYQVTLADFGIWQRELAGRPNVTLKRYPALNHLFSPGTGPSTPVEYGTPGHVDPEVIDDIAKWILK